MNGLRCGTGVLVAAICLTHGAGAQEYVDTGAFFVEARYNAVYGRHGTTTYVPIVFGTEW